MFVVGHPAHVHLFRFASKILSADGHEFAFAAVDREVTTRLLDAFRIPYFIIGRSQPELLLKALDLPRKDLVLLRRASEFRPDLVVSTGSPYAAHTAALLSCPHLVFGDTEHATLISRLTLPFTDAVCTPASFQVDLGPKHVRYNGSKELAYLHPKYFRPDAAAVEALGLSLAEPYIIVRFASWDASHDLGDRGFAFRNSDAAAAFLKTLETFGRVVVTSDRKLPHAMAGHSVPIPPERMHDVLAYSRLYIGEGATMAAEAGILGVPWVFVSTTGRGFLAEQQNRYGLGYWETTGETGLRRAMELLSVDGWKSAWKHKREALLAEKADVTKFVVEFIERWPASLASARQAMAPGISARGGV